MKTGLTEKDYQEAAKLLGCEVAAIKAVAEVESRGDGFLPTGEPKILFERHIFSKRTNGAYDKVAPDISNRVPGGYIGGAAEHKRLQKAVKYNREEALKSASYGRFQILGTNYKQAGYTDIQSFINAMYSGEVNHLLAFCNFIINDSRLLKAIREKNWPVFAKIYNGPAYIKNNYHNKMKTFYEKYSKQNNPQT